MTDVTLQAVLLQAAGQFGLTLSVRQREQLEHYAELVAKWQRITNLTAATSALAFAREHIVDALAVVVHVAGRRVLDVGSGNGLPGMVLAVVNPALAVTLLEPRARRARFLTQVRIELGLANVEVVSARVERYRPAHSYDIIIAQAFGSLGELFAATARLHQTGTQLLAMKGRLDADELAGSGITRAAISSRALAVPGFADRHLVVIECCAAPGGGPADVA